VIDSVVDALTRAVHFVLPLLDPALFYLFAGLALASAAYMVTQRNPNYGAFAFVVTLVSLSAIYALLGSPFIAVLQIVVYAGAIMVLFLFVLMLLSVKGETRLPEGGRLRALVAALALAFLVQVGAVLTRGHFARGDARVAATAEAVARELFSQRFLYVFEATSILILAALVGAIVLAKKEEA
jgi:NADH-quinone oxidoreductase subunit J